MWSLIFFQHIIRHIQTALAAGFHVWHTRHEDLALVLQRARDPQTVDALYAAALVNFEYLQYNENYTLARKCTWALADIGTDEARARLEELERSPNSKICDYARKRLESWQEEMNRKMQPRPDL